MTPRELIAAFEILADAPDGVKRLRELVLQLAVRGKLVAQDPADEPGVAQLERLKAEYHAPRAATPPNELYEIPTSWIWARFDNVAEIASNLVDPRGFPGEPHVAPDAIEKATGRLLPYRTIAEDGVTSGKHRFYPGQILYSKIRPNLSKVVRVDFGGLCSADMYPINARIDRSYLHLFMLSRPFFEQVTADENRLAMPKVNQFQLSAVSVAVAPLAEQRRIVARVNELMGLLDRLEAARTARNEVRRATRDATLAALRDAEDPEAVEAAWARVSGQMDTLFTDPEDVAPLRQTILQMAVKGRIIRSEVVSVPLNDVVDPDRPVSYGVLVPGAEVPDGVPLVRIADLHPKTPAIRPEKCIAPDVAAAYERVRLRGDELLLGVVGSIGKVGVARAEWAGAVVARAVVRMGVKLGVSRDYVRLVLQSPIAQEYFRESTRTLAQPTLNVGLIRTMPIPLPALEDQERIVAKVDDLLALCDALKARLTAAGELQAQFAAAAVHHLDV